MARIETHVQQWLSTYPRDAWPLILAGLTNAIGSALLWPLTTIYVHNVLHRSYGEAGMVLFFQSAAGILGQVLGGSLYHRLGVRRLVIGSLFLTGLAQLGLIAAKSWIPYVCIMVVNGLLNAMTMPAISAFIGFRWRSERYKMFNAVYVFNNIGVAVGTALAGILAAISFDLTFLMNGVTTLAFSLFFHFYLRRMSVDYTLEVGIGTGRVTNDTDTWTLLRNIRLYLFMAVGTMALSITTSAWNSGVAPFLNSQGRSPATYSLLWTVNGIVILLGQPLLAFLNRWVTKSLHARLIASAVFYSLGFLFMLLLRGQYPYLVTGMVIATFGEMLMAPTGSALITQTTGRSAPFYLGLVGGIGTIGRLVGPPLFGAMFDVWGVMPILAAAVGTAVLATLSYGIHRALRSRDPVPESHPVTSPS